MVNLIAIASNNSDFANKNKIKEAIRGQEKKIIYRIAIYEILSIVPACLALLSIKYGHTFLSTSILFTDTALRFLLTKKYKKPNNAINQTENTSVQD